MPPTISETEDLVARLFEGVVDKGGKPYADHCERVANSLPVDSTKDEVCAAFLHDVIEDTPTTAADLRALGYSERTIWLVERLTRAKGPDRPSYMDYIRGIAATRDRGLIAIKLADNADNSDPARIAQLPEAERGIADRYARARKILESALA